MDLILQRTFLENTLLSYMLFFSILLLGLLLKRFLSKLLALVLFKFFKKYTEEIGFDKLLALLSKPFSAFILLMTFYFAFHQLKFPEFWHFASIEEFGLRMSLSSIFQIAIIIAITWIFLRVVDFLGLIFSYRTLATETKLDDQLVSFLKDAIKILLVIFSIFFILGTVFKLNIASLVAGLGIGGLAIALAAKETVENLIGSFTIFLDKPFTLGDTIRVGTLEGTVENIGFRSTRIRTPDKSYVTVPNKRLVDGELENLSLRIQRRVKFNITLIPQTKEENIKSIVADLQVYIGNHVHIYKQEIYVRLYDFGTAGSSILVMYFIDTIQFDVYLNVREEINYKIIEVLNKYESGIAYANPSIISTIVNSK
ncbi:MAG: mechanosensitive ion channel family protein [Bacteroidia bacterium]